MKFAPALALWLPSLCAQITFTVNQDGAPTGGLYFVPVPPCRAVDTRLSPAPRGGPAIPGDSSRDFPLGGSCGIPADARAFYVNVTAVPQGVLGYLSIWPTGQSRPVVSTLNSLDGRIKASAAVVSAGAAGTVSIFVRGAATHVVLDVAGYFVPRGGVGALAFYPVFPCRILDTRKPDGALAGPRFESLETRTIPVLSSSCGIPPVARAYSLNYAVIPDTILGYLATWPAGGPRPLVSTLNALAGTVTANAAIVPAGSNGSVSLFVTNAAHVIVDANGYFAPEAPGGLAYYTLAPCRVFDSRWVAVGHPIAGSADISMPAGACGLPAAANAYAVNAATVPYGPLGYLTLWPQGQIRPQASTLNALDGAITSNAAIVPSSNGLVSAFAPTATELILDVNGYFAP